MDTTHALKPFRLLAALVGALVLSSCASQAKFACPAQSTGYGCKSTLEVYELTSHAGIPATDQEPTSRSRSRRASAPSSPVAYNSHGVGVSGQAMALQAPVQQHDMGAFIAPASLSLGPGPQAMVMQESAEVARMPAQVMRIWIAPWTDERGDLHRPSHIYTEIVARRWAMGGDVRADEGVQASFDPNGPMFPKTTP